MKVGDEIEPMVSAQRPRYYATEFHAVARDRQSPIISQAKVVYMITELVRPNVAVVALTSQIRDPGCPRECLVHLDEWQPLGTKTTLYRPEELNAG